MHTDTQICLNVTQSGSVTKLRDVLLKLPVSPELKYGFSLDCLSNNKFGVNLNRLLLILNKKNLKK